MVNSRSLSYFLSDSELSVFNSEANISLKCSSYYCIFMHVRLMFVLQIQDVYIHFIRKTTEPLPKKAGNFMPQSHLLISILRLFDCCFPHHLR